MIFAKGAGGGEGGTPLEEKIRSVVFDGVPKAQSIKSCQKRYSYFRPLRKTSLSAFDGGIVWVRKEAGEEGKGKGGRWRGL